MFTQTRDGFGLDLDSGQWRHAIEQHRHPRRVSNSRVVIDERLLRHRRTIKIRRDDEHGFCARSRRVFDLLDGVDSALLSGAYDQNRVSRRARDFDDFEILTLVEMNALPGRTEDNEADHTPRAPLLDI